VGSLLVTVLGSGNALRLVGVNASSGQLDYDGDASGLLGSFAPVGDTWGPAGAAAETGQP
jgi:formylmethanofuran dehydrogenase subunit C